MRESANETIKGYLEMAQDRMNLYEIERSDLEKLRDHLEKALEEVEKELGDQ